jgi:hypothetical protein
VPGDCIAGIGDCRPVLGDCIAGIGDSGPVPGAHIGSLFEINACFSMKMPVSAHFELGRQEIRKVPVGRSLELRAWGGAPCGSFPAFLPS